MNRLLVGFVFVIVAVVAVASCSRDQQPAPNKSAAVTDRSLQPTHEQLHTAEYAAKGRVPAYYTTAPDPGMLQPTLSPDLFTGDKRLAYQAAKDTPQILAQLPCYCGFDRRKGGKCVHSCFESEHGAYCGICIGEALMAYGVHREVNVGQTRKQIIAAYGTP